MFSQKLRCFTAEGILAPVTFGSYLDSYYGFTSDWAEFQSNDQWIYVARLEQRPVYGKQSISVPYY